MICEQKNDSYQVSAVLVSYNPDLKTLCAAIEAILLQVSAVFIVDNASANFSVAWLEKFTNETTTKLHLLPQKENLGIAAAQNIGIEQAMQLGANFVLLLDQDSVSSPSMVTELLAAMISSESDSKNIPVAAVGPTIVDRRTGNRYYFMTNRNGFPHKWMPPTNSKKILPPIEVSVLVASGTLISTQAIKYIGAMRSNYFINHVDTEWCLRAQAKGYKLLGVPSSKLEHQFGDTVRRVWFLGFRQVIYHSPLRNYYDMRNTLLMLRTTTMPWRWKLHFIWRLGRLGYFMLFAEERWLRFKLISLGLWHGIAGVSGCLESKTGRCHNLPVSTIEPR
jgi:rhamnosyltransferase